MKNKEFTLLIAVLIIGAFLRFWWIGEFPLGLYPDEAMNGSNALEALSTGEFKWFYPENNGREGFFINIQALSVWLFGNTAWALRTVSGIFGTLTILGIYLLAKELFRDRKSGTEDQKHAFGLEYGQLVAILSAFFLATNYWHVNFSRIGFRAISVPFFATFALYFLLKGLRTGKISALVFGGIFMGLGFHTYIAFRFMPFVIAVPIIWYLWQWLRERKLTASTIIKNCAPCTAALFLFITFITALPIGIYFLQNPQDFVGRSEQVSIFSAGSPIKEFMRSNLSILGMYFFSGDCNWRHNFNCAPQLHPLVAASFALGIFFAFLAPFKKAKTPNPLGSGTAKWEMGILLVWFMMMTLPATLTREGLPHALRAIGTIPPVMILAAFGTTSLYYGLYNWLSRKKEDFSELRQKISRIQRELSFFLAVIFLVIPFQTYYIYFFSWGPNPNTYSAFATDLAHMGNYLNSLPPDIKKYIVVNNSGVEVRGISMPAQTVMFLSGSFTEESRRAKNIEYLAPAQVSDTLFSSISADEKTAIFITNGEDMSLVTRIQKQNPLLKTWVPEDFMMLRNFE
ncbi:MAG: glycosyltransferase family 39 protein [Candidatus Sungbacteria bacterium]|nr:glycosyltransferase family 39 protein [Candidatus Sungbacteria bacterium]